MIAFTDPVRSKETAPVWQANFLAMEPQIRKQALIAFRTIRLEAKSDLIAEVIANAFVTYARLVERGKEDLAYPTPLARFAIRQVCAGRRVGAPSNNDDICSIHVQRTKGITVERLHQWNREQAEWRESLLEDRHAGPAETAAARIDIADWFRSLARWKRKIAKALARGETTSTAVIMYGLTAGRISQLRQELKRSWEIFQGESALA